MGTQEQGLTGYSLSLCICDILRGTVKEPEVEKIVASTNVPTRADFLALLDSYSTSYWADNPAEGKAIALRFYDAGKIDQPRTRGEAFTNLAQGGKWRKPETPEVKALGDNGMNVEGLVGATEVEQRRTDITTSAVREMQEGAAAPFKTGRPFQIKTPRS